MLELALTIAVKVHKGQVDKAGKTYISHPIRVAHRCKTDDERIVALLHDTIEDTDVTVDYLRELGFSEQIIIGVLSVTRNPSETYREFIIRASKNPIGKQVKIHDLEDNMDITRLQSIRDKDIRRLNKYLHSWRYLTSGDEAELEQITE